VHEAHDHCRSAPGYAEDFHTVSDDVEQCFQVGQVVYTYSTSGVYTLDYCSISTLGSNRAVGGTLQFRSCTHCALLGLGAGLGVLGATASDLTTITQ